MILLISKTTKILDLLILFSILSFIIFFYFNTIENFNYKYFLFLNFIAFFTKLLYWMLIKRFEEKESINRNSTNFFSYISSSILLYITPTYFINIYQNLELSDYTITVTLIIILALASYGAFVERHLSKFNLFKI